MKIIDLKEAHCQKDTEKLVQNFEKFIKNYDLSEYSFEYSEFVYPVYLMTVEFTMRCYENFQFLDEYILRLCEIGVTEDEIVRYLGLPKNNLTIKERLQALKIKQVICVDDFGKYQITRFGKESLDDNRLVYETTSNSINFDSLLQIDGITKQVLPINKRVPQRFKYFKELPGVNTVISELDEQEIKEKLIKELNEDKLYDMEVVDRNVSGIRNIKWKKTLFSQMELVKIKGKTDDRYYFFTNLNLENKYICKIEKAEVNKQNKYLAILNSPRYYFNISNGDIVSFDSLKAKGTIDFKKIEDNKTVIYFTINDNIDSSEIIKNQQVYITSKEPDYGLFYPGNIDFSFKEDIYESNDLDKLVKKNNTFTSPEDSEALFEAFLDDIREKMPIIYNQKDKMYSFDYEKLLEYNSNYDYARIFKILFNAYTNKPSELFAGCAKSDDDERKGLLFYRYVLRFDKNSFMANDSDSLYIRKNKNIIRTFLINMTYISVTKNRIKFHIDDKKLNPDDGKLYYHKYDYLFQGLKYKKLEELFRSKNKDINIKTSLGEFLANFKAADLFSEVKNSSLSIADYRKYIYRVLSGEKIKEEKDKINSSEADKTNNSSINQQGNKSSQLTTLNSTNKAQSPATTTPVKPATVTVANKVSNPVTTTPLKPATVTVANKVSNPSKSTPMKPVTATVPNKESKPAEAIAVEIAPIVVPNKALKSNEAAPENHKPLEVHNKQLSINEEASLKSTAKETPTEKTNSNLVIKPKAKVANSKKLEEPKAEMSKPSSNTPLDAKKESVVPKEKTKPSVATKAKLPDTKDDTVKDKPTQKESLASIMLKGSINKK